MDFHAAETDLNIAEILIHQGRLGEADEVLSSALRVLRASGIEFASVFGDQLRARLLLARGDLAEADRLAAEVVDQFDALGSQLSASEANLLRAQVAIERGLPSDALELVRGAERSAGAEVVALAAQAQLIRATALHRLGEDDQARAAIEEGLESARAQELLFEEAQLLELRADLTDGSAASPDLAHSDAARAHALLTEMGVRA
jgi:ATP/maltotriose-dependent transcriptional regulator MalT